MARQPRPVEDRDMASVADELMALARSIQAQHLHQPNTQDGTDHDQQHQSAEGVGQALPARKLLALAEKTYEDRRRRDRVIGQSDLFGEPAWDILLDLFVAYLTDKDVSVSSACIGSASPPTTGLRWLSVLEDNGLVLRQKDLTDQRRTLVRISDTGIERMGQYFNAIA